MHFIPIALLPLGLKDHQGHFFKHFLELQCYKKPCKNGAACTEGLNGESFTCHCAVGFTHIHCETSMLFLILSFT